MENVILYPKSDNVSNLYLEHKNLFNTYPLGTIDICDSDQITIESHINENEKTNLSKITSQADSLFISNNTSLDDIPINSIKKFADKYKLKLKTFKPDDNESFLKFCNSNDIEVIESKKNNKNIQLYNFNITHYNKDNILSSSLKISNILNHRGYKTNINISSPLLSNLIRFDKPLVGISNNAGEKINILFVDADNKETIIKAIEKYNPETVIVENVHRKNIKNIEEIKTPIFFIDDKLDTHSLIKHLRGLFLKSINIKDHLLSDRENFINNEQVNFHRFETKGKYFLFESNSRIFWKLSKFNYSFLDIYYASKIAAKVKIDELNKDDLLNTLEFFNLIRYDSIKRSRKMKLELATEPTLEASETIFSFVGKKKCNMKCDYCFMQPEHEKTDSMEDETEEIDLNENLIHTAHQFAAKQNSNSIRQRIDYSLGGEPMFSFNTYKKLWSITNEYDEKNKDMEVALGFLTNATMLDEKTIEWFNKNHHWIGFSLDGSKESHNKLRKLKDGDDAFSESIGPIKKVLDLNWEHTPGANAVLSGVNPDVMQLFLELWEIGFKVITIKPVRTSAENNFAITSENIPIIKEGYIRFTEFLIENTLKGNLGYIKGVLNPIDFYGRFLMRTFLRDKIFVKRCGAGNKIFSMRNNGDFYPCDSFNGSDANRLGNIEENTYNRESFLIDNVDSLNKCNKCWARYLCGGLCRYNTFRNNDEENTVSKGECELTKFLISQAGYLWSELKLNGSPELIKEIKTHILIQTSGASW